MLQTIFARSIYANQKHLCFTFFRLLQDPFNCINEVQKQPLVGMCFATPVRSTGNEDMSNLSDWKLTDEEFAARLEQQAMKLRKEEEELEGGELKLGGIPDVSESSLSEEEHTMTSASYFDAKYEHIKETRPPQPLFAKGKCNLLSWCVTFYDMNCCTSFTNPQRGY